MKKQIIASAIILMIVICFSHFDNSYAQESEDNTSNNIILFVPQKMIVGESYYGMITLLYPSNSNSLIFLSVDDDFVLGIDSSVNIQTNKNHGTFNITPLNEGDAIISILYDGELLSANTSVFAKKSDAQKLKIILPTNATISTNMKGMVFLLDGNDSPIQSSFDRVISLVTTEKINTPNSVTIHNGSSYTTFDVTVYATGEIARQGRKKSLIFAISTQQFTDLDKSIDDESKLTELFDTKIVMGMSKTAAEKTGAALDLTADEIERIKNFKPGNGLLQTGTNSIYIKFEGTPDEEKIYFSTTEKKIEK